MAELGLFIGLCLPWLLGYLITRRCLCSAQAGATPVALGCGYLIGIFITTLLLRVVDALGLTFSFWPLCAVLLALCAATGLLPKRATTQSTPPPVERPLWQRLLFALFMALIVVRLAGLAMEVIWRPLFPWDAWISWGLRARVWFELGHLVTFVTKPDWLALAAEAHTSPAAAGPYVSFGAYYPATVSLIQVWAALALGTWNDSLVNLPWFFCALSLGLAIYGHGRAWGACPWLALLFTYLLISLPILNTHTALAGYADLWLGTGYALAAIALLRARRGDGPGHAALALVFALMLPLLKLPGWLLLTSFAPLLAVTWIRTRWLWVIALGIGLALYGLIIWGGIDVRFEQTYLGKLVISHDQIVLPFGMQLFWPQSPEPLLTNYFLFDNWHLLAYLFFISLAIATVGQKRPDLHDFHLLVASGIGLLFAWLLMTRIYTVVENFTYVNRAALFLAPLLVFYCLVVWSGKTHPPARAN